MARRKVTVTLTLSIPSDMRPEVAKLELRSRINELCGYSGYWGDATSRSIDPRGEWKEVRDDTIRATSIKLRRAK